MPIVIRTLIEALAADLRFAIRYFARHKATTAIIITVQRRVNGAPDSRFHFSNRALTAPPTSGGVFCFWGPIGRNSSCALRN